MASTADVHSNERQSEKEVVKHPRNIVHFCRKHTYVSGFIRSGKVILTVVCLCEVYTIVVIGVKLGLFGTELIIIVVDYYSG